MSRIPLTITITIDQRFDHPTLRIVASEINPATEGESTVRSQPPPARTLRFDLGRILQEQSHKQGVSAIIGQWPGDETDEQIEQAIRDIGE